MGFKAQEHARNLPREIKLHGAAAQILDNLSHHANDKDADDPGGRTGGRYIAWPAIETICRETRRGTRTVARALNQLEFGCGFYLIQRRKRGRGNDYVLYIRPEDLTPEAILARKQAADEQLSAGLRQPKEDRAPLFEAAEAC